MVTVAPQAVAPGGSSIFLTAGERLRVRDLLAAALIQSANDSAFALAAEVGDGSVKRFVRMMNAKAAGARARRDALRAPGRARRRRARLDGPRHASASRARPCASRSSASSSASRRRRSRRTARSRAGTTSSGRSPGLIGVKTGHTDNAGWAEVAAARRGPTTVYAVVLGSPSRAKRNADLAELLEWAFDQYATFTLVREGERYATAAVPFAEDEQLELVAAAGASKLIRLGDGSQFVERVVAPAMVELPVRKGQKLGEVVVMDGDEEVARVDLVAARDIAAPSFEERARWYADRALDEAGDILSSVIPGL